MTQEQINTLYNLTILIHEHEWFGKRKKSRDREEVQEWVSQKLASSMGIYTVPVGMSWGSKVDRDKYIEYWTENTKIGFNPEDY